MVRECRHKNEYYYCKRLRMLEYLRGKGFLPIATLPDIHNPKYHIWKFKNTPELEDAIDAYFGR